MSSNIPSNKYETFRVCMREPIPEIATAARYLDDAVSAHLIGRFSLASDLIRQADMPAIRAWTDSLWGSNSPYVKYRDVPNAPPHIHREKREEKRKLSSSEERLLLQRDGYHCRFCNIPLIRDEVRVRIKKKYPHVLSWKRKNIEQHAAFQAMWVQYDHVVPFARGGNSTLENMIITCAPCNYGRMNHTLEEVGLIDPRTRKPIRSTWDGLERFR